VAAAVAIAVRLPFLLKGQSFFTSDEAVEGLMARHLGDLPVFFWGQGHKGVPEVYVEGAVFAIFGAGVIQLKSVTLAIWAAAVALLVKLTDEWHGRVAAVIAALLLVTGPAPVVIYSLAGTSEFALLPAVIAAMLLEYQHGLDRTPAVVPPRVAFWCGLAIWIHPVGACAVAALAMIVLLRSERWMTAGWGSALDVVLARDRSTTARAAALVAHTLLAVSVLSFAFTWLGGSLHWGPIKVSSPMRELQNATILVALAVIVRQTTGDTVTRRRAVAAFAWFLAGLAPVLIHVLRGGSLRLTATHLTADAGTVSRSAVLADALTGVAGLRDAWGHPLGLPWWSTLGFALALAIAAAIAARALVSALRRRSALQPRDVFPQIAASAAAVGLMAGGLQDAGSSRHLIPFMAVLMVSLAGAIVQLGARSRVAAIGLTAWILLGFVWSEQRWYQQLLPDDSSTALLRCLEDHHVYFANADYSDAYRLTFLSHERVIVIPDKAQDRYPPYRRVVEATPEQVRIDRIPPGVDAAARTGALCRAPLLTATLVSQ
jgi:hypothetical protein